MSKEIEDKLKKNEQNTVKAIDKAFDDLAVALVAISGVKSYIYNSSIEVLGKGVLADIDLLLRRFIKHLDSVTVKGVANSWVLGEILGVNQLDGIVPRPIIDKAKQRGLFTNEKAMNDFISRKSRNLTLSQRVWNLQQQIRKQIEETLQTAISEGRSATQTATDLKKFLKNPDKLFRRVRDADGSLKLSKAAKAYHPGQGVYRSSFQNALRLARNEINKSYRYAEYVQRQGLDFVVGIEIRRSNNRSDCDICERLKGVYPKTFCWSGWHVSCRCHSIPVVYSEKEFIDSLKGVEITSNNQINDYPQEFKSWCRETKSSYKPNRVDWIDDNPTIKELFTK